MEIIQLYPQWRRLFQIQSMAVVFRRRSRDTAALLSIHCFLGLVVPAGIDYELVVRNIWIGSKKSIFYIYIFVFGDVCFMDVENEKRRKKKGGF